MVLGSLIKKKKKKEKKKKKKRKNKERSNDDNNRVREYMGVCLYGLLIGRVFGKPAFVSVYYTNVGIGSD
jgi:hypothetical protein